MKILDKLEWNKITEDVSSLALTELGKEFCYEMPLHIDTNIIQKELDLVDEAVKLSNSMLLPHSSSQIPAKSHKYVEFLAKFL